MLKVNYSSQFKKDFKRCQKQGLDTELLKTIIMELAKPARLPEKNKDHKLSGNYAGHRECHVLPDWLLIYYIEEQEFYAVRTGSHAELFGK